MPIHVVFRVKFKWFGFKLGSTKTIQVSSGEAQLDEQSEIVARSNS